MKTIIVNCKGDVKGCEICKEKISDNGYCVICGRPLKRKIGEKCGETVAHVERGYVWKGQIRIKCRFCKTVNVI